MKTFERATSIAAICAGLSGCMATTGQTLSQGFDSARGSVANFIAPKPAAPASAPTTTAAANKEDPCANVKQADTGKALLKGAVAGGVIGAGVNVLRDKSALKGAVVGGATGAAISAGVDAAKAKKSQDAAAKAGCSNPSAPTVSR